LENFCLLRCRSASYLTRPMTAVNFGWFRFVAWLLMGQLLVITQRTVTANLDHSKERQVCWRFF